MKEIPVLDRREAPRARRWDAIIIGSGIRALVAAARIGASGGRVLVVEEADRTTLPAAVREPFFLGGLRDEGLLDATLKRLSLPLIDRRRIANEQLAFQIAADPYRLDVGSPSLLADELVSWGLLKPDESVALMRRLIEASEIERRLLLESPFVHLGRRIGKGRSLPGLGPHRRGLPGDLVENRALRRLLDNQIRALSNLGASSPTPEAQARLLGLGLAGGAGFSDQPPWLVDLLRKRVTGHYGDFRSVSDRFEFVSVAGQPGVRVVRTGEIWLGRAMILAAEPSSLCDLYRKDPQAEIPSVIERDVSRRYRAALLFRVPIRLLPEGMAARLIVPTSDKKEAETAFTLTAFPSQTRPNQIDLVARGVLRDARLDHLDDQVAAFASQIAERLREIMPFLGDHLDEIEVKRPQWDDDDGWLEDPDPSQGWPGEMDLRLSSRPPIYHLDRSAVAGLGLEGDLLLGWRAGDAIAEELA